MSARRDVRAVTGAVALLSAVAIVTNYFPAVEHVLNIAALVVGGVVVAVCLGMIVRDTWL